MMRTLFVAFTAANRTRCLETAGAFLAIRHEVPILAGALFHSSLALHVEMSNARNATNVEMRQNLPLKWTIPSPDVLACTVRRASDVK